MLDDYAQVVLVLYCPGIERYLQKSNKTLYSSYVVNIDIDSTAELDGLIKKLPGLTNVGIDGETVNGKQNVSDCTVTCAYVIIKH